jgi:hypothetical protein
LEQDPAGASDGPNTYAYVHDAPVNRIDPLGLSAIDSIRNRITNGVTDTAEWIFNQLESHPELYTGSGLAALNAIADRLHRTVEASHMVDTNPNTAGWKDLFLSWLFEVGPAAWSFGPNARTTADLKHHHGVEEARRQAQTRLREIQAGGSANPFIDYQWTYGVPQFWTSLREVDTAAEFLGSYSVHVAIDLGCPATFDFTVSNITGWASGTHFRRGVRPGGPHRSIIQDRARRGPGIHLGGTIREEWNWSEEAR